MTSKQKIWLWSVLGILFILWMLAVTWILVSALRHLQSDMHDTLQNANAVLVTANSAAQHFDVAAQQTALAATEQRAYWSKTSLETYKTMASLRLTITRTDQSFNDVLVPKLGAVMDNTANLSTTAAEGLRGTLGALQPTFTNLAQASAAAAVNMSDPAIPAALDNIRQTSERTAAASEQIAGAASDVHTETGLIVGKTREAFKPQNKALVILKALFGGTVGGAELWYYLSH